MYQMNLFVCFFGAASLAGAHNDSEAHYHIGKEICYNNALKNCTDGRRYCLNISPPEPPLCCECPECPDNTTQIEECMDDMGGGGEPHFHTMHGDYFDYHGVCDLVMMQSTSFGSGSGLDLHVRTEEYEGSYSIISNAALRIGSDVLEVVNDGSHFVNGVPGAELPYKLDNHYTVSKRSNEESQVFFPDVSHGFTKPELKESILFDVDLGNGEHIEIQAWKMFLWVNLRGRHSTFQDGAGLMGTWGKYGKIARDGTTDVHDPNEFAEEWQVLGSEAKLFQTIRSPQYPEKCLPAPSTSGGRRLGDQRHAEEACSNVDGPKKENCIFDVMVTGDPDIAQAYQN